MQKNFYSESLLEKCTLRNKFCTLLKESLLMITVKLSGGLGNQFFQYAAGRAVQEFLARKDQRVTIEYQSKTDPTHADREIAIQKFKMHPAWNSEPESESFWRRHPYKHFACRVIRRLFRGSAAKRWKLLNRRGLYLQEGFYYGKLYSSKSKDVCVEGMWHSDLYASPLLQKLREELRLKEEYYTDSLRARFKNIKENNSVCVHVRRGDYLTVAGYAVCTKQYFERGMEYMRENTVAPTFYVFSDDIEWCKNNLTGDDIVFCDDQNPDYLDFEIMRNCNHFIISNSTFSWWAAYLGDHMDKKVVLPDQWSASVCKSWLVLDGWVIKGLD